MADEKEKSAGKLCHLNIEVVENGYKLCVQYDAEKTLGQRAGWVPCMPGEHKTYVEKTKDAVLKRLKEVL
jgi:hypothetical protein